ncbi:MAG: hypothetical protein AAFZ52_02705 [Bacteroidota bacterium]
MKALTILNLLLLVALAYLFFTQPGFDENQIFGELRAERLTIVGADGHQYIVISNPDRQAIATQNHVPIDPKETPRDMSGILFFNRTGDEIGGIFYDGTDSTSAQGITFDQMNNDQVMAIMKDEYYEDEELRRWYGMFFRERSDETRRDIFIRDFLAKLKTIEDEDEKAAFRAAATKQLNEEIDTYRLFLGREENEEVGLFLYDSKGRERIKLYVDAEDRARLTVLDSLGNAREFAESEQGK